ncbi:type II toxin-antitoxin system RelE/ParE family toxin [Coraliomargarita sp. SDUM461003]|uniref:Type II toxin-antitoxin system RelE/ParE family toxin n=1 Tax=Thalassobacterium maritimum TaxID=3041265 RepID=A0ABU1AZM9_9BACT|nr:type II toxin-antitoxin system RelE/ParE family toxin [Coraliomargarita sp. SDUM461003]MDQ8209618.1 type II toxin-antitoxin system RelE/ParE family toxin [Coraliomargarita sp. SDUM461003]
MIQSFRCKETAKIFGGCYSKKLPADIQQRALNKLRLIATVTQLETLRVPPSNHLEALTGDRKGQHSIRINNQWRICFHWKDGNAHDAEIVDYH